MPQISGLGLVGLYCNDLGAMRDFYARVLGLTISDEDLERGICFLSAAPDSEHHELALVQAKEPAQKTQNVQQEGNRIELYYTTPYKIRQPLGETIDLDRPDTELLAFARSFEGTKGPPRGAQRPVERRES